MSHEQVEGKKKLAGPLMWGVSCIVGIGVGVAIAKLAPGVIAPDAIAMHGHDGPAPAIPLWLCAPFVLLLASIALMPFINGHFWHDHFPDFAFFFGGVVAAYYAVAFNMPFVHGTSYGVYTMLHAGLEYYSFIALVVGLFVVSGGIVIDVQGHADARMNTILLAIGAVVANLVGTTGASMLLIRPFMRLNAGRIKALHVVFFIFIVSNCGGALTPIGDPPLYLGFLKGVPFTWTIQHLWQDWLLVNGLLLVAFFVFDSRVGHPEGKAKEKFHFRVRGRAGVICLLLMLAGVFVDPLLKKFANFEGFPVGATVQTVVAISAYFLAGNVLHKANHFDLFPAKEVGLLFLGIFATMAPALGYLAENGAKLGINTPTAFYFATGSLSAVLDNAPTYLNFFQAAFGAGEMNAATIHAWLLDPVHSGELHAISTAAVFFGAMTYIGNGPNFMVRSIAQSWSIKMPSFFGYLGWAAAILLPILVLNWFLFFVVWPR